MPQATIHELGLGYSPDKLSVASTLQTTTKIKERDQQFRKTLIKLSVFVEDVLGWQLDRPPLYETDQNVQLLVLFFLGELEEILEHREIEGLPGYDFKSEKGETIDAAFFLAAFTSILRDKGQEIDFNDALARANGQANGSHAIELLREVGGNVSERTLQKDLQYLWTIWVSYVIHMKYPVNPNQVLHEYTFPKNNGNYVRELLQGNPIFENEFRRKMNREEKISYFAHYRKAVRLIRDFVLKYIDPSVEHTGLRPEHYRPYKDYIYNFMKFNSIGITPKQALSLLEDQLYRDYNIERSPETPRILRANTKIPN